jgi:hypothetical protein
MKFNPEIEAQIQHYLALDGHWHTARKQLDKEYDEQRVQRYGFLPIDNKNFGIVKAYIDRTLSKQQQKWVWNGTRNVAPAAELLYFLDPDENISYHVGVWRVKYGEDGTGLWHQEYIESKSWPDLIQAYIKVGGNHRRQGDVPINKHNKYARAAIPLEERLNAVSHKTQSTIRRSLQEEREDPKHQYHEGFWQPKGENFSREIFWHFRNLYAKSQQPNKFTTRE